MAHTEQVTTGQLRSLDVFRELPEPALEYLLNAGQVRTLSARRRLSTAHQTVGESYCFLLRGVMVIALDSSAAANDGAKASKRPPKDQHLLGYFEAGACFSNGFLAASNQNEQPTIDCIAANAVTLLEVPAGPLGELLTRQPRWRERLAESVGVARNVFLAHQEPTRRAVQDFFLRENYVTSSIAMVGRLDRCLDCNKCHDACEERHGVARMARFGPTLGRLTFPIVCRNCHDQPCVAVCKFDAIAFDPASRDIHISDNCVGCGACAKLCPNDAISMVQRPNTDADFPELSPYLEAASGNSRVRRVLVDPAQHAGQHVLVVGTGDAALETAFKLAEVPGTSVTMSYRQESFPRTKASNRKRLETYQASGKIRVALKSTVAALEPRFARLQTEQGQLQLNNDVVFAVRDERQLATKCDHCAGYADRACLTVCPTGALIEVETDQLFRELLPHPQTNKRSLSEAPFLEGVPTLNPVKQRHETLKGWIMALTLLFLAWLGIESFLIRTQPASSLLGHFVAATGVKIPVSFTSGRGIGHWFGYIGTGLMLASVLYTLRTRVNRFRNWGSQTGWLSAHLWLGFTGATLVTYHAAFKLDRWASIACYLMWLVIITGAIGRYAFGRVHSAVALAAFEMRVLREKCNRLAAGCGTPRSARALMSDILPPERRSRWPLRVMLWEESRDAVALFWLWAFGTRHLPTRAERRDMFLAFRELAMQRRREVYYQSAKAILRHWNIIHIVLTIAMFILAGIHVVYGFLYKAV